MIKVQKIDFDKLNVPRNNKYAKVYTAVNRMKVGEALKVTLEEKTPAFYSALSQHYRRNGKSGRISCYNLSNEKIWVIKKSRS